MNDHVPLSYTKVEPDETRKRAEEFYELMRTRRSVRFFSNEPVPEETIQYLVATAARAPSGANKQPWTFVVVKDPKVKREIRIAAEQEEKISYETRMTEEWLADLAPLGTDWHKPFLETAPYLIIPFKQLYGIDSTGKKRKHYYVNESIGIAIGMLIAAIHYCGLVTLTHTPSPMNFLRKILKRPENERPVVVLPVGYPAEDATVPNLQKKALDEVMKVI
ncbi:MAG: nitroreductase family protein [Methanobacteriota archaeon]|nr:MAG: nitroreductase family protein [Euryarchaeota archaeon]